MALINICKIKHLSLSTGIKSNNIKELPLVKWLLCVQIFHFIALSNGHQTMACRPIPGCSLFLKWPVS